MTTTITEPAAGVRQVVVLGFEGYPELQVWYPVLRFREQGADVVLAGTDGVTACASALGYPLMPQAGAGDIEPAAVALLLVSGGPGATAAAQDGAVVALARAAHAAGAVVAAIGEGTAVLQAAGLLDAAPGWSAGETTADGRVLTARDADALPALVHQLVQRFEGRD
jgi:protease I